MGRRRLRGLAIGMAIGLGGVLPGAADAYAPLDAPGPALSVAPSALAQALSCSGSLASSGRAPILLVPGTTVTPTADFSWNWERALDAQDWPYCTITLPENTMGDIQVAGEYVVYAIRTMYARAGRRIDIVGHSQGGMVPRWALRFWPDTRAMVDDLVGLAPSNHGTLDAGPLCALGGGCAPAIWQQRTDAAFISALNSGTETFPGISYTVVFSRNDEVVTPNFDATGSSALHGGAGRIANVAIQQVCPLDPAEHLAAGTYDNTAYAIAMDALTHDGPADPSRIPAATCLAPVQPGVDPLTFATDYAAALVELSTTLATSPHVSSEPPLACYVTATCPVAASPQGVAGAHHRRASPPRGRHHRRRLSRRRRATRTGSARARR